MIAGDALDRFVTVPIENRTRNIRCPYLRAHGVKPRSGAFANLMSLQYPWHRENRATVSQYAGEMLASSAQPARETSMLNNDTLIFAVVPKAELVAAIPNVYQLGALKCFGSGGVFGVRLSDFWQWTAEVSGCTLGESLPRDWSGDSLTFSFGPQWILHTTGRWSPHAHFRIGGHKITEEYVNPQQQKMVLSSIPAGKDPNDYRYLFTKHWETTGPSISVGGGLDLQLSRALALRIANLDYTRSWVSSVNGNDFGHGLRVGTGLIWRLGTW